MKEIKLPKELLNLPQPWHITHPEQRCQQLDLLSYDKVSTKTGLNVLERCLYALSQLTFSKTDCIPEDMITYWAFSAEWLAEKIPTFNEFDLLKVKQFLIDDEGIPSPSSQLVFDVAEYWIWWITWDIESGVLYWLENALMATRDQILILRFLHIVSRYWHQLSPDLAEPLLSASAIIGWQKALPLFDCVEQYSKASETVKETARDYRQFVMKHREKWWPDSEALDEISTKKNEQVVRRITPPALGQLAYVS